MTSRILGRTGFSVSGIGLGTVELGLDYGLSPKFPDHRPSIEQARSLLDRALDAGVNLIDTARAYGESEAVIGSSLGSRRGEYLLASKVLASLHRERSGPSLREGVIASVRESLRNLRCECIDLMYIHEATLEVLERGEVAEVLEELRRGGAIRWIGASTYGLEPGMAALRDGRYDVIQLAHNAIDRRHEGEFLQMAQAQGCGVVVRSVLLRGVLTPRYRSLPDALEPLRKAAECLEAMGAEIGISLPELAVRYGLSSPGVSSVLVGTGRWEELEQAIGWCAKGALPPELLTAIGRVSVTGDQLLYASNWPAF